jgi:hypothetical protein
MLQKYLSFRFTTKASLFIYGLFFVFHLVVVSGILLLEKFPIQYLWGGRMKTKEQLLVFEIISLLVLALCMFFTLVRSKYISLPGLMNIAKAAMWVLFVLFFVNTLGNIFAKTAFEKYLTIVTAILSIFLFRIALEKEY